MAFQVSPGINVSEIDLTSSIPAVSVSTGGIAGNFNWGPVEEITSVSGEVDLVNQFGAPTNGTANVFFTAASFLAYSNDLLVVRATAASQNSAVANANSAVSGSPFLVKNSETYFNNYYNGNSDTAAFVARYPGSLGNSLSISVCPSNSITEGSNTAFSTWAYKTWFDSAPGTSPYASNKGSANDEIHVIVVDQNGLITGTPGTILEKYPHLSKASDARNDDGSTNYFKEVLYKNSKYVYWTGTIANDLVNGTNTINWGTATQANLEFGAGNVYSSVFHGGNNGTTVDSSNAYSLFTNSEYVDISLLIGADANGSISNDLIQNIAEVRKDCVAFISPPLSNVQTSVTSVVNYRNSEITSSSYGVMDSGWKYMYDKYSDVYRWVPLNGDTAGLCARTDNQRDPWFSPAGYQRGVIKNVVKLALNPNKTDRDNLYKAGINPVVSFPGEGTVLFGDKTILSRPSAFDRINVRRLFIVLEKAISRAAKASLFEFNDEFTRASFVSLVEPFLRTVQGRRGIYDFRVVCDETNNTPDIIDQNQFVGDIYIKPARSVNFIQLNFIAVRSGVAFDEVVGKF